MTALRILLGLAGAGAALMIRSGTLALRRIGDFFGLDHPADPAPTDPIAVTQAEFAAVAVGLAEMAHAPPSSWMAERLETA